MRDLRDGGLTGIGELQRDPRLRQPEVAEEVGGGRGLLPLEGLLQGPDAHLGSPGDLGRRERSEEVCVHVGLGPVEGGDRHVRQPAVGRGVEGVDDRLGEGEVERGAGTVGDGDVEHRAGDLPERPLQRCEPDRRRGDREGERDRRCCSPEDRDRLEEVGVEVDEVHRAGRRGHPERAPGGEHHGDARSEGDAVLALGVHHDAAVRRPREHVLPPRREDTPQVRGRGRGPQADAAVTDRAVPEGEGTVERVRTEHDVARPVDA
ncbi:hypothetical protein Cus16_3234 [Curtobacterium sp. ER1/6]|nr:hypothetical protein Cus16_3234 [Curtobacterium sp. ER1/6]